MPKRFPAGSEQHCEGTAAFNQMVGIGGITLNIFESSSSLAQDSTHATSHEQNSVNQSSCFGHNWLSTLHGPVKYTPELS